MFGLKKEPTLAIGVVGLGLIGGSLAKSLNTHTNHLVYGCEQNSEVLEEAFQQGAINEKIAENDLSMCDIVFLALYPHQAVEFVTQNIREFQQGAIVIDLCGVKRWPTERLTKLCADSGLLYIGGHPMAGRECWGFSGSTSELFRGASMILTPTAEISSAALDLLTGLFADIGFASITTATPEAHDSMIAFTSQLAHVVSSAYIKSPRAQQHKGFSAGSYKDLTRVAKLNAPMWTELFVENADMLVEEIDTLTVHLSEYRQAIAEHDAERLCALLEDGRRIKEALDHEDH